MKSKGFLHVFAAVVLLSTVSFLGVIMLGCQKNKKAVISQNAPSGKDITMPSKQEEDVAPGKQEEDVPPPEKVAVLETTQGTIVIELYPDSAPGTVANFKKLIQKEYYDGLTFHRYIEDFMIQGGDPTGNGTGGPGYTIKDEFNERKHLTGTVAMAKTSAPDSAGSQFYICLAPQPHLDGQYTVFGQVIQGMDNVFNLRKGDKMSKVTLQSKSQYVGDAEE